MRWLLAGYCGLALINISVAVSDTFRVTQKPRFYGVKTSRSMRISCLPSKEDIADVEWYKVNKYNEDPAKGKKMKEVKNKIDIYTTNLTKSYLHIHKLSIEDSGVYFCNINNTWGPGTEVQVARPTTRSAALYRTQMKDGLIVFQGLMLAMCIAAILLHKRAQEMEKRDSIYEEPETDHIYEGLTIETCGGGLYEELSVYAQPEGAEAPWE